MPSGRKKVQINNLERAVSADLNRQWSLQDAMSQQVLRRLLSDVTSINGATDDTNGVQTTHASVEGPLRAAVLGGLMAEVGSGEVTVTAGTMLAVNPGIASDPDDSPYVFVDSAGFAAGSGVSFTVNAGPGIRVDVLEVQIENTVAETASRDIYDPVARTFSPATVDKVLRAKLNLRLRLGTAGGGYPGHASGWLPLAVAITPTAAANFDGVTFYDVRPLVADRITGGPDIDRWLHLADTSPKGAARYGIDPATSLFGVVAGALELFGTPGVSASDPLQMYRVGGRMRKATPTVSMGSGDLDYIQIGTGAIPGAMDTFDPENTALTLAGDQNVALLACFPEGLPRWIRYSELAGTTGGTRRPWGPNGIVIFVDSMVPDAFGFASVALPATVGLTNPAPGRVLSFLPVKTGGYGEVTQIDGDMVGDFGSAALVSIDQGNRKITFDTNAVVPPCVRQFLPRVGMSFDSSGTPGATPLQLEIVGPSGTTGCFVTQPGAGVSLLSSELGITPVRAGSWDQWSSSLFAVRQQSWIRIQNLGIQGAGITNGTFFPANWSI